MEQKMMVGVLLAAGSMILASCERDTKNNAAMKMPLESSEAREARSTVNFADTTARIITGKKISK